MSPCLHDLVARQAAATPKAVAVRQGDRRLSYRQLDRWSNQIAHRLRAEGAGPERVVAVLLPRSPELLVTLLGVLKAGAAYLPLSIDEPDERTAHLVADSGAILTVTEEWLRRDAPATDEPPDVRVVPENLAYVIYTSGSTGKPKGVQVEHRQAVAYLRWSATAYETGANSGAPLHSSAAHDLSATALYAPLLSGTTVIMLPESPGAAALLPRVAEEAPVSFVKITPSHLPVLADGARPGQRWPKRIVTGGDVLTYDALRYWAEHVPDLLVVNEYGPTETTIGCSAHEFRVGTGGTGSIPLGEAIAGTTLHVLDADMSEVDNGELYVGGPLVTRGYLGLPGVTASAYVPDPFATTPGARLYRTGDLVRRTGTGNLVFVGRADRQLKIRGFRVHPAEVETALCAHDNVESAVVDHERRANRSWLVAYLVAARAPAPSADELRTHLAGRLPPHMIPNELRWLPELPLTPNGKVDRTRLGGEHGRVEAARPRTPTEAEVAEVFTELLGYPPSDLDVNFMDLGGDSVGAAQLMARLSTRHQVDVPLDLWHMAPTVAGLARLIDTYRRDGRDGVIAMHTPPELDGFSLDEEIVSALEIGEPHAAR